MIVNKKTKDNKKNCRWKIQSQKNKPKIAFFRKEKNKSEIISSENPKNTDGKRCASQNMLNSSKNLHHIKINYSTIIFSLFHLQKEKNRKWTLSGGNFGHRIQIRCHFSCGGKSWTPFLMIEPQSIKIWHGTCFLCFWGWRLRICDYFFARGTMITIWTKSQ